MALGRQQRHELSGGGLGVVVEFEARQAARRRRNQLLALGLLVLALGLALALRLALAVRAAGYADRASASASASSWRARGGGLRGSSCETERISCRIDGGQFAPVLVSAAFSMAAGAFAAVAVVAIDPSEPAAARGTNIHSS